jgi:hypothetical protein
LPFAHGYGHGRRLVSTCHFVLRYAT